jgi:hypothetical protein
MPKQIEFRFPVPPKAWVPPRSDGGGRFTWAMVFENGPWDLMFVQLGKSDEP